MEFSCWCFGWLLSNSLSKLLEKIIYLNKLFKINLLKSVVYSIIYFLFIKFILKWKINFHCLNKNSGNPFQWRFPFKWRIVHWMFLIVSACYQVTFYLTKDTFIWKTETEIVHAMSELEKKKKFPLFLSYWDNRWWRDCFVN